MNERSGRRVKAYIHTQTRTYTCIHSLWRGALKRTGFAGEHISYTLTRALFCLSHAPIPMVGLEAHRLTRGSRFDFLASNSHRPLYPLILSKISKSMTRRRRSTAVLFEQRVTFLARRFPIEMLMKCDDSGKLPGTATRDDINVATLLSRLLSGKSRPERPIPRNRELCEF